MSALAVHAVTSGPMAAPGVRDAATAEAASAGPPYAPINFVYRHLHDAIRAELDRLTTLVADVESRAREPDVLRALHVLRERYHLLVQVNRCHSSVEDEARRSLPALHPACPSSPIAMIRLLDP
jgi:hypothetical protein